MRFIDDFNSAFSTMIVSIGDDNYKESSFVNASYLWIPIAWFLSIIVVLLGYFVSSFSDNLTVFFSVMFVAFFLKGITNEIQT